MDLSFIRPRGIFSLAGDSWHEILQRAGASLVTRKSGLQPILEAIVSGNMHVKGRLIPVDFIVLDSHSYSEKCVSMVKTGRQQAAVSKGGGQGHSGAKASGGAKGGKSSSAPGSAAEATVSGLSDLEMAAVQACMKRASDRARAQQSLGEGSGGGGGMGGGAMASPVGGTRVVSVDWVVHCVGLGQVRCVCV